MTDAIDLLHAIKALRTAVRSYDDSPAGADDPYGNQAELALLRLAAEIVYREDSGNTLDPH